IRDYKVTGVQTCALPIFLAVQERYRELNGRELALAITLSAFLSILPLVLVGIAVFGFFSAGASKDLAAEAVKRLSLDTSSDTARSEERRVGKECRSRGWA